MEKRQRQSFSPVGSCRSPQKLLIIGNGGASISAIKAARGAGYQGTIHLVSDKKGPAFNPMLSPYYLSGEISHEQCFPYGNEFYKRHSVRCHLGSPAEAMDIKNQKVYLGNGKKVSYDHCLIATGANPLLLPVPGIKNPRYVFTLRTAEQMIHLQKALSGAKKAIILGASLLGVKLADVLVRRGMKVTLVELAGQVLPFSAHPELAPIIHEHLLKHGVDLRLGLFLKWVEEARRGVYLHFQGDQTLEADMVLVCVGVKPNSEFLKETLIKADRGIIVDDHMRTNVDNIYAAGDVTQGTNQLTGKKEIIGLWGNACYQGRAAGLNISGVDVSYPGYFHQYVSHFFGITFMHLGNISPQGKDIEILKQFEPSEGIYRLFIFDKGALIGANLINSLGEAGQLKTSILRKQTKEGNLMRYLSYPSSKDLGVIRPVFYPFIHYVDQRGFL